MFDDLFLLVKIIVAIEIKVIAEINIAVNLILFIEQILHYINKIFLEKSFL